MEIQLRICILLYFCMSGFYCQDISLAPLSIPQPNWGVMFHKVGTVLNGVSKYRHTFALQWPYIEKPFLRPFVCDTKILYKEDCERINRVIEEVSVRINERVTKLKDMLENEKQNIQHITLGGTHTDRKKRDTDKSLGDDYCDKMSENQDKEDTSLLGTVGKVSSDIFGLPTNGDIKALASHVCNQAKLVELDEKEIHESNDRLTSMSNVLNNRITNIKSGILDAENRVNSVYNQFKKVATKTQDIIDSIELRLNKIQGMVAIELELQSGLYKIQQQVEMLSSTVHQWILALNRLTDGYLPVFLVSRDDIENVLQHLKTNVLPRFGDNFKITHDNPQFYYKLKSISYTRTDDYLMIMVTIPVHAIGGLLSVYRVDTTHMSLSINHTSSTIFKHLPEYFATTTDSEYYTELDVSHFVSCVGETVKVCPAEKSLRRHTQKSCVASLFYDSAADIMEQCDIRYEKNMTSGYAMQISEHHYFLHSSDLSEKWELVCPHAPVGFNEQNIESCNSCIMEIPCFCKLLAKDFVIPYQLTGCDITDNSHPQPTYHFGVNLPLIHSLFSDSDLSEIKGDILKENEKWNIKAPDLNINSSNFEDVIQKENLYESAFQKLMIQHKKKAQSYATKADKVLKKAEDFSDLANSNYKDMKKLFGGKWLRSMLNPHTMVGGVSLSVLLSLLSIAGTTYTCCRQMKS